VPMLFTIIAGIFLHRVKLPAETAINEAAVLDEVSVLGRGLA